MNSSAELIQDRASPARSWPGLERGDFAPGVAERLMSRHEALPDELKCRLRDLDLIAARSTELRHTLFGRPILTSTQLRVDLRAPPSRRD
ncbi:hypothetical protein [Streptomyces sp. NPDC059979]|uniref:hypothetical protein n=1 Tax=Streptomyces sp. NPDC059979 TaxID=3347021 RepID=UPI003693C279